MPADSGEAVKGIGCVMAHEGIHPAVTDRALVAAVRNGDTATFTVLVERYQAHLVRTLIAQTRDPELAADLVQETFQRAYQSLDRLVTEQPFGLWLYGIARNVRRAALRRQRLRRFVSLEWLLARGDAGVATRSHAALGGPDEAAAVAERELVRQVLASLSPALRETLLLRYEWGFTSREIAHLLGVSHDAAQRRLGRATVQFRDRYCAFSRETATRRESNDDAGM